ncbi:BA14K family protein [uncultured Roseibium sp.]|uniref:BA14K family protein n=1 Tax=uncultured Roseibium sp. TaxID=1936171 RepID=UPI002609F9D1|nr:BA14K family protein [uncultured Roseibium sp.]
MFKKAILTTLAIVGLAAAVSTTSAFAGSHGHKGGYHHKNHGYHHKNHGYHHKNRGFRHNNYWYRHNTYKVQRGNNWQQHVAWCSDRYRSYRAQNNTFQPFKGQRRLCSSPYFKG